MPDFQIQNCSDFSDVQIFQIYLVIPKCSKYKTRFEEKIISFNKIDERFVKKPI